MSIAECTRGQMHFKIIRPVYETLTVNDPVAQYQDCKVTFLEMWSGCLIFSVGRPDSNSGVSTWTARTRCSDWIPSRPVA